MPLEKLHQEQHRAWGLWHIREDENSLLTQVATYESVPAPLTNSNKRLEFIAGRVLVKHLMIKLGLKFLGVHKNEYGKPFPTGCDYQLSLSHSYPYVAALIDRNQSVGIDLEQPKSKLLKIAPRVLNAEELSDAGSDLMKHCIYWCSKEAMIKIHGKKDLVFAQNLIVSPFEMSNEGHIIGRIIVRGKETKVPLYYTVNKEFVVVLNT